MWEHNWMKNSVQRVFINGSVSYWKYEVSFPKVCPGSSTDKIFISDLKVGTECSLIKSVDHAKLGGIASTFWYKIRIQNDHDKLGNGLK